VPRAQPIDHNAVDEIVAGQRCKTRIEGKHDGKIEADALEDRQLLRQRRQVKVRLLGMEKLAWMRLEDERTGRDAKLASDRRRRTQQRLVAAVDAIEIADGEHGTTRRFGHIPVAVNDLHRTSFSLTRPNFCRTC
jgi:hypothetical protein